MYTLKNFALQFITINTPPTIPLIKKKMDVNDPVNKSIKVKSPCIDWFHDISVISTFSILMQVSYKLIKLEANSL